MQQNNNNNNDQYVNNRQMKRYTIFVGNPGVGKSTLLNGLAGKIVFKSGVSFVGGLTEHLQLEDIDNDRVLGDTPGLSDINKRKQAAKEIEKALRKNGFYRIVFVITLESGRVKPDDATTIRLVLESISTNVPFAILINKLPEPTYNKIKSNKQTQKDIVTSILASNKRVTSDFHAIELSNVLNDKKNAVAPPQTVDNLKKFLETLPFAKLMSNQVSEIKLDEYEKMREKYDEVIAKLKKDKEFLQKQFVEFKEKLEKENKERELEQERRINELIEERDRINKEHELKLQKVKDDQKLTNELIEQQKQVISSLNSQLQAIRSTPRSRSRCVIL